MFFRRSNSIRFTDKIKKKKQIPILIKDKQWKQLFANSKNKSIENLSKELAKLLKEEDNLQKRLKDHRHRKRILMNKIIHLSDRLNVQGVPVDIEDMENAKNEITTLNEEMDKIRQDLLMYPKKIENINIELLEETAKIAYLEIDNAENRMEIVDKEINLLRERLGQYWDEKEALEKKVQTLYSLLHSIIGSEEIEKIDKKFFGGKEDD